MAKSPDIVYFMAIQNAIGATSGREALLNDERSRLEADLTASVCYHAEATLDDEVAPLIITPGNNLGEYIVESMPSGELRVGQIASWVEHDKTERLVIMEISAITSFQHKGVGVRCNHLFQFQDETGKIVEVWGVIENPYSRSRSDGKILQVPYNQLKFILPYNDHTKKLYKGKRIAIDKSYDSLGNEIPVVYKIINNEAVTSDYGDGRMITIIAEFDNYSEDDSLDPLIANYFTPQPDEIPEGFKAWSVIMGDTTLRHNGSPREYTAVFYDNIGRELADVVPVWAVDVPSEYQKQIVYTEQDNKLIIRAVGGDSVIGASFNIVLVDTNATYAPTVISIKVVNMLG